MKRKVAKGQDRKPHVFRKKNANGKNDTRPIKFTPEFIEQELKRMLAELKVDSKATAVGHTIYYRLQLFEQRSPIEGDVHWSAMSFKHALDALNHEKLNTLWEVIGEILECRLAVDGVKGITNTSMTKFMLTNHYPGWIERQKVEVSGQMEYTEMIQKAIQRSEELCSPA